MAGKDSTTLLTSTLKSKLSALKCKLGLIIWYMRYSMVLIKTWATQLGGDAPIVFHITLLGRPFPLLANICIGEVRFSRAFEKLFRKIFQNALVSHQKRIMENISSSAESRYRSFRQNYPKIELMVPQKYIASYLGITPEFLSKMRSKK